MSSDILAALRDACAKLYPEESSARVVVADAGLDEHKIAFSPRAETNWHNIWLETIRQNQVNALITVMVGRYPTNPSLQSAVVSYQRFLAAGGRLDARALLTLTPTDDAPAPGEPPYQGMAYYDVADTDRFFGREALTAELIDHLRQQPLLAVVGASGSGKSSLVRAGVLPALQGKKPLIDGKQPPTGSARWAYYLITPTARPLESLAASLTRSSESVTATSTLIDDLRRDQRSLHLYARRLVSGEQRLMLLVDQFEELFTLCKDRTERQAFVENLLYAVQPDGVVTLLLTLRADFYHHCADFPALRTALETHQRYIGTMTPDELRRAIAEPAHAANWSLQPGLVEQLLQDVGDEPGALPLLSHALLETWQRRRGRTLTLAGYRTAGGVQGAIAKTADDVYNRFTDGQKTIARIIFLRLTELGEGVQDTRRRVRPAELKLTQANPDAVQQVLKTLADARLVTTDEDEVQVAHEALIRHWATLRAWLDDDREGQRIHHHLAEAAQVWQTNAQDLSDLYRGNRLSQTLEWLQSHSSELNELEAYFLQVSQAEVKVQQEREIQSQMRAKWIWRLGFALLLTLVAVAIAIWQYNDANMAATREKVQRVYTQIAATSEAQARATAVAAKRLVEADLWQKETRLVKTDKPLLALLLALEAWPIQQSRGDPHASDATRNMVELLYNIRGLALVGHTATIYDLEFSPDNRWLVSASEDTTVRLWAVPYSDKQSEILLEHPTPVRVATFSPDSHWLATSGDDKIVRLWAMNAPDSVPQILSAHSGAITKLIFSEDSQSLAMVEDNQTITIQAVMPTTKEQVVYNGYTEVCNVFSFTPSASEFGTICKLITLQSTPLFAYNFLSIHNSYLLNALFNPNQQWLVGINNAGKLLLWSTTALNEEPQAINIEERVNTFAFSPDNLRLAIGTAKGIIHLSGTYSEAIQSENNPGYSTIRHSFHGHEAEITAISFSPDGKWLASASADGMIRLWSGEDYATDEWQKRYFPELRFVTIRVPSGCTDFCSPIDPFCVECQTYEMEWDIVDQVNLEQLATLACLRVGRNFTLEEWQQYLGNVQNYRPTCPQWPIPPDVTVTLQDNTR